MANETKKKTIFLIGFNVCLLILLALPWVSSKINFSKISVYRKHDANRLRNFALSFRMGPDNQFPPSLVEFAEGGGISPGSGYVCPGQPERTITLVDIVKGNIDYVYVGAGLSTKGKTPSVTENGRITSDKWLKENPNAYKTVVMHTKPGLLDDWVNFLFLDGHVEGVETSNPKQTAKDKGWRYSDKSSISPDEWWAVKPLNNKDNFSVAVEVIYPNGKKSQTNFLRNISPKDPIHIFCFKGNENRLDISIISGKRKTGIDAPSPFINSTSITYPVDFGYAAKSGELLKKGSASKSVSKDNELTKGDSAIKLIIKKEK